MTYSVQLTKGIHMHVSTHHCNMLSLSKSSITQLYKESILWFSVWVTTFSHTKLTLIHFTPCTSQSQQSLLGYPPSMRRRVLWRSSCDVKQMAACRDLSMGRSGPWGASLCQCCMKDKQKYMQSLQCLHWWTKAGPIIPMTAMYPHPMHTVIGIHHCMYNGTREPIPSAYY